MNRRLWLKYGLGGAALLGVGGVGLMLQPGASVPLPPQGLKALTPRRWATLSAAAAAINPGSERLPTAAQLDVAGKLDQLFVTMDPDLQDEISLILDLLENPVASLLFDGRTTPFSALDQPARVAAIKDWQNSRLSVRRAAIKSLLALVQSVYWAQPETWAHVGYPGPPQLGGARAR